MFIIKKIFSVLFRPLRRLLFTQKELIRIADEQGELGAALSGAIQRALDEDLSPAEQEWVEKIESLRGRLLQSSEPLEVIDYGAGTSMDSRSEEEMLEGTPGSTTVGIVCGSASKKGVWSQLLFQLVRAGRPQCCVEMGCSLGLSCAYQGAALLLNEDGGRIVTMEGAPAIAAAAEKNWAELGIDNAGVKVGRFADTLDPLLAECESIDYVFIDGHHDHDATLQYFEKIYPKLSPAAIVVFDDIYWTAGMRRAWQTIEEDPRVSFSIDLFRIGLAVVRYDAGTKASYKVAIH